MLSPRISRRRPAGAQEALAQLKVRRAQALLVNPNHTVKDVAAILGFEDPYYFSRLFKRKTRRAPSAFRLRP